MTVDEAKEYVLTTLLRPLEELAHIFQSEFARYEYYTDLHIDWSRNSFVIEFRKNPTSDMLREITFGLYKRQWGGKPEGIEVAYRATNPVPDWREISPPDINPIQFYVTCAKTLREAMSDNKRLHNSVRVLDDKDFKEWEAYKAHEVIKRVTRVKTGVIFRPPADHVARVIDPGEPVPVYTRGLFKI